MPEDLAPEATFYGPALPEVPENRESLVQIYGSFWIDKTEFALPVSAIQEVVNEPQNLSQIPLAPPHMLGVFNLRGVIVPVVDLRVLLGFPPREFDESRKVAIIENGHLCMGLLFCETGEVLYADKAGRIDFQPNEDGERDVVVEGMLKFDGGDRMVQVLDPYRCLKIEKLPRVAKSEANRNKVGQRLSCISFQLGHTTCAMDLRYVQEITDVPKLEKSHLSHGHVLGTVNLRGYTLPVVDFRGVIGNEAPYDFKGISLANRKLVVIALEDGMIGMLVYSIDSIITYFEGEVLPFANVAIPRHDIVAGCLVSDEEEIVILLDHDVLAKDKDLNAAAKACQEIYPEVTDETEKKKKEAVTHRRTFILFKIDRRFALDVACVGEVIDRPEQLLSPPFALDFVDGILNLRGELITLVNPRKLYNMALTDEPGKKVLVVQQDGQKYGMAVDSVDEIVMTSSENIIEVPPIAEGEGNKAVSQDVAGCLRVGENIAGGAPVMILNIEAMVRRCAAANPAAFNQPTDVDQILNKAALNL